MDIIIIIIVIIHGRRMQAVSVSPSRSHMQLLTARAAQIVFRGRSDGMKGPLLVGL